MENSTKGQIRATIKAMKVRKELIIQPFKLCKSCPFLVRDIKADSIG